MQRNSIENGYTEVWNTPKALFAELDAEFHFTLDPCCNHDNALCKKHYTREDNGLLQDWGGESVYCNPPYGRIIKAWVEKAFEESKKPSTNIVMLLPARTDTSWFHDYIWGKAEVRFVRGRLHYNDGKNNAPFPSMIVIFKNQAI